MCRGMYVCECAYGEEKHSCREKCLERFCVLYSGRIQIDILTQTVQWCVCHYLTIIWRKGIYNQSRRFRLIR